MKKAYSTFRPYLYILISAVLCALSFAPFLVWPLALVALWPVFYLLETENFNLKRVLIFSAYWALCVNFLGYHWLIYTIEVFGHIPFYAAVLIFILYSLASGSRFFLFLFLHYFYRKYFHYTSAKSPPWLWYTFFWGISELIGWQLFPWYGGNLMGGNIVFMQAADLVGVKGLSLVWFSISLLLYEALMSALRQKKREAIRWGVFGVLFFGLVHLYGFFRYRWELAQLAQARYLRVGVVQGNSPLSFANMTSLKQAIYDTLMTMVHETLLLVESEKMAGKKLDLIVWPESATPFLSYQENPFFQAELRRLLEKTGIPIIVNDILYEKNYPGRTYSNMFLLQADGRVAESYQKIYLLPFGEYMPFSQVFPFLAEAFPEVSHFSFGERLVLFPLQDIHILPAICYEVIISPFMRQFFAKTNYGADLLINITNDTWFGKSIESSQHLELGRWRSVELRRPMVRATNSGISAMVDSAGRVFGKTPLFVRSRVVYEVPLVKGEPTLYARLGESLYHLMLFVLSCLTWVFQLYRYLRGSNPNARR
ncbi:MAG: apolipoprotein N-acyltransferase [Leptospiraceae bacterium]|nr:apolipoprotein N-acyltransferase [Leptospiraceae bacterium]MDW8306465.1 apolipoprotein N-acyltransferase [Leptospiraceae bacterium]